MIEAAAEGNDELTNKYLEAGTLSDDEIKRRPAQPRSLKNEIVLSMCGTAFKNKGVQALLDAVIEFMPSPIEVPDTSRASTKTASPITRKAARRRSRSRRSPSRS